MTTATVVDELAAALTDRSKNLQGRYSRAGQHGLERCTRGRLCRRHHVSGDAAVRGTVVVGKGTTATDGSFTPLSAHPVTLYAAASVGCGGCSPSPTAN